MTETEIAKIVVGKPNSPFYYRRHFCVVPRVSWGFQLDHEADLLAVTKTGYMWECEIKSSYSDFIADFGKSKWKRGTTEMRGFYYAIDKAFLEKAVMERRPLGTGLIAVWHKDTDQRLEIIEKAKPNPVAKIGDQRRAELARLGCMRLWDDQVISKFWSKNDEKNI